MFFLLNIISGMKMQMPEILEEDLKNQTVNMLVETLWKCFRIIQDQAVQIAQLKDEIAKLKGQKPRPKLSPSKILMMQRIILVQITLQIEQSIMKKEKKFNLL